MGWEAGVTVVVPVATFTALAKEWLPPPATFVSAVVALFVSGVIPHRKRSRSLPTPRPSPSPPGRHLVLHPDYLAEGHGQAEAQEAVVSNAGSSQAQAQAERGDSAQNTITTVS